MTPNPSDPSAQMQRLSDDDLDELAELLGADWAPEKTMDIEQLDGLLAGLICSPRVLMPSVYLPEIFGGEEPAFPDMATAQRFFDLLMRRNNQVATALNAPIERLDDPRAYVPLLLDWSPDGEIARSLAEAGSNEPLPLAGELWARGFLHAVSLAREDWETLPEGDEEGAELVEEALDTIAALVPDDDEAGGGEASADERDELIGEALVAAYDLREYWRDVQFEQVRVKEPIRREPKIGRNDPCPCGSGKKFKQCHGREH
jgi:uncharacterized protein